MTGPIRPNKPGAKKGPAAGARPNTLGLGQRELGDLLDRFESPDQVATNPKRDFVRWPFRQTSIRMQVIHPGGVTALITVACRNVSRTGIAILHSSFLHTGTKCKILLPHPARGEVAVDGWITRCSHRSGVVHEIGIRFDKPIEIQEYLKPSPFTDWFSLERVKAEALSGSVVVVEDSEIDRKILSHFLRETHLNISMNATSAEALATIDDSADLILVDFHLPDMTGTQLAAKIREKGLRTPVIILTCDTQAATAEVLNSIPGIAFLSKPLNQDLLLRAIGEFLIVRKPYASMHAPAASDQPNPALTEGLLTALGQYAKRLEDCLQRQDATSARTLCLQIAATAGTMGLQEVNKLAAKAADTLTRSMSTAESISPLRSLIAVCHRAGGGDATKAANPSKSAA